MPTVKIALANLRIAATPQESVDLAIDVLKHAALEQVDLICFPECYVPGYRAFARQIAPPDAAFLDRAWSTVAAAARTHDIGVVLGTERIEDEALFITALVIDRAGALVGFQDKVQLDPSEDAIYTPGTERRLFQAGGPHLRHINLP